MEPKGETQPLPPGGVVEHPLPAESPQLFEVSLVSGEVLHVEAEERGVDFELLLRGPAGEPVASSDGPDGGVGLEMLTWVAATGGRYTFDVHQLGKDQRGAYRLVRDPARPAASDDAARVRAEQAFGAATRQFPGSTPEASRGVLAAYGEALALGRASKHRPLVARSLRAIASLHRRLKEPDPAVAALREAAEIWGELGRPRGEADALVWLGEALRDAGDLKAAVLVARRAAALWESVGEPAKRASALHSAGHYAHFAGLREEALADLRTALSIYREEGLVGGQAHVLNELGLAQVGDGSAEEALQSFDEARRLAEQAGDQALVAEVLATIGNTLGSLGRLEEAIDHHRRSLALYRQIGNQRGEGQALSYLGGVHASLGDHRQALVEYREGLAALRAIDHGFQAALLTRIGAAHRALDEPELAISHYEEALVQWRRFRLKWGEGLALAELGSLLAERGEVEAGEQDIRQGLALSREIKDTPRIAIALRYLGEVARRRGDWQQAIDHYGEALELWRREGEPRQQASALAGLAKVERARGDLPAARARVEEALALCERLRRNFRGEELRAQYLSTVRPYYELYLEILYEIEGRQPGQGAAAAALEVSERARARVLLDLLAFGRIDPTAGIDPDRRARWGHLRDEISTTSAALLTGASGDRASELEAKLRRLEGEREVLAGEIRLAHPNVAELALPSPPDAAALTHELGPEEALLEYFLGEERSFLMVATREAVRLYALPPAAELVPAVEELRRLLRQPGHRLGTAPLAAFRLYERLVAPAEAQIASRQRLLVAADGVLHYLPFEALLTAPPEADGWHRQPFLLRRWSVAYLPSASVLAFLRGGRQAPQSAGRSLLALADPAYGKAASGGGASEPVGPLGVLVRSAEAEGSGWHLRPLPGSAREAAGIVRLFPPREAALFVGSEAREEILKREAGSARRLHIAAHAVVSEEHPEASAVVLALDDDAAEDGLLQVREIFDLHLDAELVVLSACETALGRQVRGEGMIGFSRAFLHAGARSLAASLWQVEDRSTAKLMIAFYAALRSGEGRAEGLRTAKLALLEQEATAHPYYWASFVLIGEGGKLVGSGAP